MAQDSQILRGLVGAGAIIILAERRHPVTNGAHFRAPRFSHEHPPVRRQHGQTKRHPQVWGDKRITHEGGRALLFLFIP